MSLLICPICGNELNRLDGRLVCCNNHSFDFSKEGYVNLLVTSKSGVNIGDSKDSARARHAFLAKDYYKCLKDFIISKLSGTVLDICCGEGYYDDYIGELWGFDISKEMVRLASKSRKGNNYFVANLSHIPIKSGSIDTAIHLFAPFNDNEFSRILKSDGVLYSVIPGENHLIEMKNIIYDTPYKNDEKPPEAEYLTLTNTHKISEVVEINGEDLRTLFSMTPYFYRTSQENKERLNSVDTLSLTVEFIVLEYRRV